MRDVHPSQIGRVWPVEITRRKELRTGVIYGTYCRIDEDGFMTVPYRKS